jgi:dienelactone hydrolase
MRVARPLVLTLLLAAVLAGCSRLPTADNNLDPAQRGSYGVGMVRQVFSPTAAKGQTRPLETYVWYPAPDQGDEWAATVGVKYGVGRAVAPGRRFPLIVFSPGYQGSSTWYSSLIFHLVSHGFVVAGVEHQDCSIPCTARGRADQNERRLEEVTAVRNDLVALSDGDDPIFGRLVDPDRVGIAGQSLGGWTTLAALERDSRFRAGLALAPATAALPAPDPAKVSRPVMLMAGVLDAGVPYSLPTRFFADIPYTVDHYLLAAQRVGHQFDDRCFADMVTTGCASSLPQADVSALMARYGTAFLLRYVAGRQLPDSRLVAYRESPEYTIVKGSASGASAVPEPRSVPGVDAGPRQPAGTSLLDDDLSVPRGDHLPTSSRDPARYGVGYANGGYEITVNRPATQTASVQGEAVVAGNYGDASIAVDAEIASPTPDQFLQLACRSQGPTSQYRFGFRPATGEYWLSRWLTIPGVPVPLTPPMLPPGLIASAARLGGASNRLELGCRGTTIVARINSQTVATVQDNTFSSGQMWIAVGETPGEPGGGVRPVGRFRNLLITQE